MNHRRGVDGLVRQQPSTLFGGRHRVLAGIVTVLLLLTLPIPSAAAQNTVPSGSQPSESEIEQARRSGSVHSSLPELWPNLWHAARLGTLRLECPQTVVEGDVIRCFVHEYSLIGKIWLTVIRLENIYRLPVPSVTVAASSPSVPSEQLADRFVSPGFSVESNKRWWVFVDTVDDDSCDPQPYSLEVSMAAMGRSAAATVRVLDDGDASAQCMAPVPIEVLDASASEGDGSAVFTVRTTGAAPTDDVRVDYALTPGSASAGTDYSDVSGTLTIPAGARHATISVPLTNDTTAESDESFSLTLSNPMGVLLSDASATATITDDDGNATPAPSSPAVCSDVVLVGSVRDVFDVTQSGFAEDHHAFVDIDLTCPDAGSPTGLPIAMSVIQGPQASLGASTHCLVQTGTLPVTAAAASAAGCETFAVSRPFGDREGGRSTHLLQIPDASVGQTHQLLVWVDADRDRAHDRGEPYQYITADFRGRSVGGGTLIGFDLPDNFEASLVTPFSDRVSRAGQYTTLRLSLKTRTDEVIGHTLGGPVYRKDPVVGAPVSVSTLAGPSRTAEVTCSTPPTASAPSPGYSNTCMSDSLGYVDVRFRVPPGGVSALRAQQDTLRVWLDADRDGRYDFETVDENQRIVTPEPSTTVAVPVAKAVNYVALGDSYSAGENGRTNFLGFVGSYSNRADTADEQCRRWDRAYPEVLQRRLLRSGDLTIRVEFATFACVSARPQHVYDALDPLGTNEDVRSLKTDRPAPDVTGEPRQAASLMGVSSMGSVDLVTITIGGNDLSFTEILKDCVTPLYQNNDTTCDESDLVDCEIAANEGHLTECVTPLSYDGVFDTVEDRVAAVLAHVREIASPASVILLGYPYLTPVMESCGGLTRGQVEAANTGYETYRDRLNALEDQPQEGVSHLLRLARQAFERHLRELGLSESCRDRLEAYLEAFYNCQSLDAREVAFALGSNWADNLGSDAAAQLAPGAVKVDPGEALFLRRGADDLNAALRNAASRAGVHFVDVVGGVESSLHPSGFVGHDQCSGEPWLNGFVADDEEDNGANGKSFHPTVAGHVGYAQILWDYVHNATRDPDVGLNEAGLPVNPDPQHDGADSAAAAGLGHSGRSAEGGSAQGAADADAETGDAEEDTGFLWSVLAVERAATVSGCGAAFVSAAEKVTLTAGGFRANSTVSFASHAASAGYATLSNPTIADATADANGRVEVSWTVPAAPAATVDAAPRGYLFQATGEDAAGETRHAFITAPLVAYPGTAPCAMADTASTTLGQSAQARVLDNDTAPTGGSLSASSVRVRPAEGGTFAVDPATGVVTFTPDGGFWGAVEASYVVFDGWGVGLAADLAVTVDAGCTITGTAGTVLIEGTDGDDVICVPDRDDWQAFHVIDARGGDDVILGGAGTEWIYGGAGDDVIWGNGGDDRIVAGAGLDTIHGGPGTDSIYSVDTADTIVDDSYELVVSPSVVVPQTGPAAEDDWSWAETSEIVEIDVLDNDLDPNEDLDPGSLRIAVPPTLGTAKVIDNADGRRVVEYTADSVGGTVSLSYEVCDSLEACAEAEVTVMVGTAGCTIVGTEESDTIRGTPGDDVICGLGGDDTIRGIGGDDVIVGGPGDDDINAGDGNDTIWGGRGADTLDGGPGNDTVWGAAGDDRLLANSGTDRLNGGLGDDTITGGGGDDMIWGGPGTDTLDGHAGNDTIWGGPGIDTIRGGNGNDTIWGNADNDTLIGGAGADMLHGGAGDDILDGNTQNDTLWGGSGDDILDGGGHDDELHGGPGDDTLRGGPGADRLWAGPGDDDLIGNGGTDYLDGGTGTDSCRRAATATGCE